MKHTLETDGFKLELQAKFFEEDEQYPMNATLKISVASGRFGGAACWDLDFRQLKEFVGQLMRLYQELKGEVRLCEAYKEDEFLAFVGDGKGHISVFGQLSSHFEDGFAQSLQFENQIDQTELGRFVRDLLREYA